MDFNGWILTAGERLLSLLNGVCVSEFLSGLEGVRGAKKYEGGGFGTIECRGEEGSGGVWYILLPGDFSVN